MENTGTKIFIYRENKLWKDWGTLLCSYLRRENTDIYIVSANNIIWEKQARMNLIYGELEIVKEV